MYLAGQQLGDFNRSALMIAAEVDYADAVQDLVPLEANLRDSLFKLALHYAIEFNSLNSIQLLLEEADDSFLVQHL